jgi:hypothetical protein
MLRHTIPLLSTCFTVWLTAECSTKRGVHATFWADIARMSMLLKTASWPFSKKRLIDIMVSIGGRRLKKHLGRWEYFILVKVSSTKKGDSYSLPLAN